MQAPVVPSGPHLAYWDSKDETLVNARGMQVIKMTLVFITFQCPPLLLVHDQETQSLLSSCLCPESSQQ